MDRLGYVRQLVFSKTRLEFRLLWNKIFQREDEELGWLLSPYRSQARQDAHTTAPFGTNIGDSYQYGYDQVQSSLGRERVTLYNRGVAKKSDLRRKRRREPEKKPFGERALEIARYMGMGVYMTSTAFPSPFFPVNETTVYDETVYGKPNFSMSKVW